MNYRIIRKTFIFTVLQMGGEPPLAILYHWFYLYDLLKSTQTFVFTVLQMGGEPPRAILYHWFYLIY